MSMISEQVKELRAIASTISYYTDKKKEKVLREAADTIEVLSAKVAAANMERSTAYYNSGWIPCSERLPEKGGCYLVTYHEWSNGNFLPEFDDTYVKKLHYQNSEQFIGWNFPKSIDERAEDDTNREVLAWMPLPEPYKEETRV